VARPKPKNEEAAFLRGEVGVDGQAVEEVKDAAEVEREKAQEQFLRGKAFLGRELLTWLLWRSDLGEPVLVVDGQPVVVAFATRLVLRGISGDVVESTVKGAMAPYSPLVRRSLLKGLLVHQARVRLMHGELPFEVGLDAETFDLKSAKLPEVSKGEADDMLHERLALADQLGRVVEALIEAFLKLRQGHKWGAEVVAMRAWMAAGLEPATRRKGRG
jgi:hypothetical protein